MALQKTDFIWHNGKFVNWDDAKVHVLSHGLHYGSGVFEGIRCYDAPKGPAIFRLEEHIARLARSAKLYKIPFLYSERQLVEATKELVVKNKVKSCYIRPIIFYGYGVMGLQPQDCPVDAVIACWPWGTYLGAAGLEKGVKAKISSWKRISSNALPMQAKGTGQYLNSIVAKLEALGAGADEAILLNDGGFVAEGPGENIFAVKNGTLYTPPLSAGVLEGITRDSVTAIAKALGIPVREENMMRDFLYAADEAFFTGTAAEVTPIREVDGIAIGSGARGPVTEKIQKKFFDTTSGKDGEFGKWLEFVQ